MKTSAIILALAVCAVSAERLVHNDDFLAEIQSKASTWEAEHQPHFAGWTMSQAKRLMGTFLAKENDVAKKAFAALPKRVYPAAAVPTNFDERTQWPACSIMQQVRDQASCGSCWAFGTVEAFNDRKCAQNPSAPDANVMLSAQDMTSCCGGFTCFGCQGCDGGMPPTAWQYLVNKGVVTGGDYGTNSTCLPYEIPPCEHHVPGSRPACTEGGSTPTCSQTCIPQYSNPWAKDLHSAKSVYSFSSLSDVQQDIMTNGAVTAAFSVYEDFLSYKSGVYKHTSGQLLGGHAISIIGWGVENGQDYWLVRNSWNTDWGANGYFKIARGVDECGIEDEIVAGDV